MATYKIIQDIEAEDKFVGPLTLRQFVFACIGALLIWLNVLAVGRNVWFMVPILSVPMLFFFFLAVPWSKDQPTEMWVLARLRFLFLPRRKIWNQSGIEELVTVTAPPEKEAPTKGFSEGEARSRLKALTGVLDSHGWAIKHASLAEGVKEVKLQSSDRLVDPSAQRSFTPPDESLVEQTEDVYDDSSRTEEIRQKMNAKQKAQRAHLEENIKRVREGKKPVSSPTIQPKQEDNIGLNTSKQPASAQPTYASGSSDAQDQKVKEQLLLETLKKKRSDSHLATRRLHSIGTKVRRPGKPAKAKVAAAPENMRLASNDDRSVASIAKEARQNTGQDSDQEVNVSLH